MRAPYRKMAVTTDTLRLIEPFKWLDPDDREKAVKLCEGRCYPRGHFVVEYQDTTRDVFWVLSGRLHATSYSNSGRAVTFQDLGEGKMFGELAAIDSLPRSTNIVTTAESSLIRMSAENFMELFWSHRCVAQATLFRLANMVRHLCGKVFESHALPVKARIRLELLRLARSQRAMSPPIVLSPAPKDYEIAHRVGTTREAVNREVNSLSGVQRDGSTLIIDDLATLVEGLEGHEPLSDDPSDPSPVRP